MMKRKTIPLLLLAGIFMGAGGVLVSPASPVGGEEADGKVYAKEEVKTLEQLRNVPVEQIEKWTSYDSRTFGIVTAIENQSPHDLCWVYSSVAAAETSILREGCDPSATRENLNLDEIELAKAVQGKFLDPLGFANGRDLDPAQTTWDKGGVIEFVERAASHWQGIYNQGNAPESATASYSQYILDSFEMCNNKVDEIKHLVARYGAAAFEYNCMTSPAVEYHLARGQQNHASTIVGWDDSIPKEKFTEDNNGLTPTKDGAWIVKNSWGETYHGDGYFYLSYDSTLVNIAAFDLSPYEEGKYLYNYAGNTTGTMNWTYYQNLAQGTTFAYVFEPQFESEIIESVSVGVKGKNPMIMIRVYTGLTDSGTGLSGPATPAQTKTFQATCTEKGLYTIPLDEPIRIDDGKPFCVAATVSLGTILMDFNGNMGDTECYQQSGTIWGKLRVGDGQLPAIHPIVSVDLAKRVETYGETLMQKINSLDGHIAALGGKGFTAEGYEQFSELQKELPLFTKEEREKLWLLDKTKLEKYETLIKRWSGLVKGAQTSIEICRDLL